MTAVTASDHFHKTIFGRVTGFELGIGAGVVVKFFSLD
jgi:hypothetical protein